MNDDISDQIPATPQEKVTHEKNNEQAASCDDALGLEALGDKEQGQTACTRPRAARIIMTRE